MDFFFTKSLLPRLNAFEMWIYHRVENMLGGKDYQRGSIDKDGGGQRNDAAI